MSSEDTPDPTPQPPAPGTSADEADLVFQKGYDAGSDGILWIKTTLAVLTAEIDDGDMDKRERAALADLRVVACERGARHFRSDIEPPDKAAQE